MKFFIDAVRPDSIDIKMRARGPGMIGDAMQRFFPGETFFNLSFADLQRLGKGEHELEGVNK